MKIEINSWSTDLYRDHGEIPKDYFLMYGGRASSKTTEVTQALILKAMRQKLRIAVAREHLKSIEESAKPELEERARQMGLIGPDAYRITKTNIDHVNGSHFFFIGLSKMSEEDIKGLAEVDICWVEEAHRMSHASWELLNPTLRKDNSQIWATWNPKYRTDAIDKFLNSNLNNSYVWHKRINWRDNYFFPDRSNRVRMIAQQNEPERYDHIWEGGYDDTSAKRKVIPYALLEKCVQAWDKRPVQGAFSAGGFDVADTGIDKNALALRAGPELFHLETWRGSDSFTPSDSTRHVIKVGNKAGINIVRYDAGGVGAGVRGPMREGNPNFKIRAVQFGGKVELPRVPFLRGATGGVKTNEQYFYNWAAQAGWVLRLRANNTARLMAGESITPEKCLFINPDIKNLSDVLAELAQPEWNDDTGKLKIDKKPKEPGEAEPPSPDSYDATIMAFGGDAGRVAKYLIK